MHLNVLLIGENKQTMKDWLANELKAAEVLRCHIEYKNHKIKAELPSEPNEDFNKPSMPSKEFMEQYGGSLRVLEAVDPQKKDKFRDFLDNDAHKFFLRLKEAVF